MSKHLKKSYNKCKKCDGTIYNKITKSFNNCDCCQPYECYPEPYCIIGPQGPVGPQGLSGPVIKSANILLCGVTTILINPNLDQNILIGNIVEDLCFSLVTSALYEWNGNDWIILQNQPNENFYYLNKTTNIIYYINENGNQTLKEACNLTKGTKLLIRSTGDFWTLQEDCTWLIECNFKGINGPQGPSGPIGLTGAQGDIGPQGPLGICCKCLEKNNCYDLKNICPSSCTHFAKYRVSNDNNPNPLYHENNNEYWQEFDKNGYCKIGMKDENKVCITATNDIDDENYPQYLTRFILKEHKKTISKLEGTISLKLTQDTDWINNAIVYIWNYYTCKWDCLLKVDISDNVICKTFEINSNNPDKDVTDYIDESYGVFIFVTTALPVNGTNCTTGSICLCLDYIKICITAAKCLVGPQGPAGEPETCTTDSNGLLSHVEYDKSDCGRSYILFAEKLTYNDTTVPIDLIGNWNSLSFIPIPCETVMIFKAYIIARQDTDTANSAIFKIKGFVRNGAILEFLGVPEVTTVYSNNNNLIITVNLNVPYDGVTINVTGTDDNIKWFGKVHIVQL